MENFWDFSAWGTLNIFAVLLVSLLIANVLKNVIKILKVSLVPTSVLGGLILLVISGIYRMVTGDMFFDTPFFGGKGIATLETITYHTLALGFTASALKVSSKKMSKQRSVEIFDTGVTTVATYLIQAIFGLIITIFAAKIIAGFFPAAGILLPFGYGQGTGQAMNFGGIYEIDFGFEGGKTFGLTIAALGFLCASIGGVVHLNILKSRGLIDISSKRKSVITQEEIESENEISLQGSIDRLTVQVGLICGTYLLSYSLMLFLGWLIPGFKATIYGFNFILGVLSATLVKTILVKAYGRNILKKKCINNFLMTRVSNFFFDIMVVSGIAAIRLSVLEDFWGIILIMGFAGMIVTYFYNRIIARKLFPDYAEEQFLAMYGMLTGTASTGIILLREIDGEFKTPAADNMVYQTFPAIVFGFPLMLLATLAPKAPVLTLGIIVVFFIALNILLFRRQIFRRKKS